MRWMVILEVRVSSAAAAQASVQQRRRRQQQHQRQALVQNRNTAQVLKPRCAKFNFYSILSLSLSLSLSLFHCFPSEIRVVIAL